MLPLEMSHSPVLLLVGDCNKLAAGRNVDPPRRERGTNDVASASDLKAKKETKDQTTSIERKSIRIRCLYSTSGIMDVGGRVVGERNAMEVTLKWFAFAFVIEFQFPFVLAAIYCVALGVWLMQ